METQICASCGVCREGEVELPVMLTGPTDLGAEAGLRISFLFFFQINCYKMHCFFRITIGAKSKHVYRQINITRNMGCTHLARAEPLFSVFIIRRDTQFLIRPLGRVGIRKVTQHSI